MDYQTMLPSILTGTATLIAAQLIGYEWRAIVAACLVSLATSVVVALRLYWLHRRRESMPVLNRLNDK